VVDVYQSVFGILKIAQQTEFSQAQTVNECEEIDSKASEQTLKLNFFKNGSVCQAFDMKS
jgi:hypothetical protein